MNGGAAQKEHSGSNANANGVSPVLPQERLTTAQVCQRLRQQVHNLELTLRCPICQSCVQSATMIAVCCHVYCRDCLRSCHPLRACAVCKQKCSHRSLVAAPVMHVLVQRFKELARALGLSTARYDARLAHALTQLPPEEEEQQESSSSASGGGVTATPCSLADVHDQLQAARTFAKYNHSAATATGDNDSSSRHCATNKVWQEQHDALVQNHEQALLQVAVQRGTIATTTTAAAAAATRTGQQQQQQTSTETNTNTTNKNANNKSNNQQANTQNKHDKQPTVASVQPSRKASQEEEKEEEVFYSARQDQHVWPLSASDDTNTKKNNDKHDEEDDDKKMPAKHNQNDQAKMDQSRQRSSRAVAFSGASPATTKLMPDDHKESVPTMQENNVIKSSDDNDKCASNNAPNLATRASVVASARRRDEGVPSVATATAQRQTLTERPTTFLVGDIVQVQARTWPGVNLPGGVGRIKAVHQDANEHVSYDIHYVLGGRELKVDAIFCTTSDLPRMGRRKSNNQAAVASSQRLEQQQQEGILPRTLLAQLKSEGFDVEGKVQPEAVAAQPDFATVTAAPRSTSRKSASLAKKENMAPLSATRSNRKRKPTANPTDQKPKKRRLGQAVVSRIASSLGRKKKAPAIAPTPVTMTDKEACQIADEKYRLGFQKALEKSTVSLAATSLSDQEMNQLERLCRQKNIRVRQANAISKQTTVCIVPADPKEPSMAKVRTAKAMRAALFGIPLVTPAWIDACLASHQGIVAPSTFLRALPTKGGPTTDGSVGVAHLAARKTGLLSNYQIFLCLPTRLQQDVMQLIKAGGGTITGRLTPPTNGAPLVLMCGDTDHNVSGAVLNAVAKNPDRYQVVHSRWLFDSISQGSPITDLSSYGPPSNKANALWKMCSQA